MFEDASETDFSDVEEFDDNDSRSETGFAASLNSVACDNVTATASNFGGGVKASRDDMLGAWALMELKTGGADQKFFKAADMADETQICTTENTTDTLENWTSPGGIDQLLISETQKGQNDKAAVDRSSFAQLGKELEEWVQSQLHESQLYDSVLSSQQMSIKWKMLEFTEQGKPMRCQSLQCCRYGFMMINSLGGRTRAGFRWKLSGKWREGLHHDIRRLQSCCWKTDP